MTTVPNNIAFGLLGSCYLLLYVQWHLCSLSFVILVPLSVPRTCHFPAFSCSFLARCWMVVLCCVSVKSAGVRQQHSDSRRSPGTPSDCHSLSLGAR